MVQITMLDLILIAIEFTLNFEQFCQSLLKDISHVPEEDLSHLKTKLRNTCDKYSQIYLPHKYKKIIEQLSNNRNICIMKQDKERGVVIIDKSKNAQ